MSAGASLQVEPHVKRRRVDRQMDEAHVALHRGRLKDATAAVAEIRDLDPNNPELKDLTARLDVLRPESSPLPRGRWVAVTAGVGALVLVALGVQALILPASPAMLAVAPRVTLPEQMGTLAVPPATTEFTNVGLSEAVPVTPARVPRVIPTASGDVNRRGKPTSTERATRLAARLDSVAGSSDAEGSVGASGPIAGSSGALTEAPSPRPTAPPPALTTAMASDVGLRSAVTAPVSVVATPGDAEQVREVLNRYRQAYERLEARSAREVWPEVDEAALVRAFDALRSQRLTFDDCDLAVSGDSASAKCHGSARYVPKIGNPDTRIAALIWSFRLRKQGTDWKIQSVHAEH